MRFGQNFLLFWAALSPAVILAIPAPFENNSNSSSSSRFAHDNRGLLPIDTLGLLEVTLKPLVAGLSADAKEYSAVVNDILSAIQSIVPLSPPPATLAQLSADLKKIFVNNKPHDIIDSVAQLVLYGLCLANFKQDIFANLPGGVNSMSNQNSYQPKKNVNLLKVGPTDSTYRLSEAQLRQVIYIPGSWDVNSAKRTVILVPGTGAPGMYSYLFVSEHLLKIYTGGQTFTPNLIKLIAGTSYAQAVWLNIPGNTLGDITITGEYVAYAINYISAITGRADLAVASWSQGSLDITWAFKYWPSTRCKVTGEKCLLVFYFEVLIALIDFVAFSPDFHGTTLAYVLCPGFPKAPCDPSGMSLSGISMRHCV